MNTKQKIKAAQKRITELKTLIKLWTTPKTPTSQLKF